MERKRETLSCRLEVKAFDPEEQGVFTGYLSRFNVVDSYDDIVRPSAFTQTLKGRGRKVPLLWQHDHKTLIGRLFFSEDSYGLRVDRGEFNLNIPEGRDAYETLKFDPELLGLSIGFETIQSKSVQVGDIVARELTELRLYEGSLVTFPANEEARIDSVKAMPENHPAYILMDIVRQAQELASKLSSIQAPTNQAAEQAQPPVQSAPAPDPQATDDAQEQEAIDFLDSIINNLKEN